MEDNVFKISGFTTQSGTTLDLELAYRVHGTLNDAKDNLVVFPTFFSGLSDDNDYLIGEGALLDPDKYCILVPNLFGNGVSSSPSNTPAPFDAANFPPMSYFDNVTCQRKLVAEVFGVEHIALVLGFSMGAMQAYHWAALFPDLVTKFAAICGSARTAEHNRLFLLSLETVMKADAAFDEGNYESPPTAGLKAFSMVYASWFASQQFYSEQMYRDLDLGIDDLDGMIDFANGFFMRHDANDLLSMAATWRQGDISANNIFNGDFEKAMTAIKARGLVMPCDTDLYFRVRDNEREVALLENAKLAPIRSDFGHLAGGGFDSKAVAYMTKEIGALLES